jgi:peptide/nickel transport system permease protein
VTDADLYIHQSPQQRRWRLGLPLRGLIGLSLIGLCMAAALFAPWIAPYNPNQSNLMSMMAPPSLTSGHLLGTDDLGRDILSRVVYGARPVMIVATSATLIAVLLGALLGMVAGYAGRVVDQILARLADVQLTIPGLVLALLAMSLFGPRLENLIVVLAIESWPLHFRVTRSYMQNARTQAYMEAAWLAGVPTWLSIWRHVVPGLIPLLSVTCTISAAFIVMIEAGLSFIGLGVQPPTADWGLMISQGKSQLGAAWWLSMIPALALVILLVGVQMLGDSLSQKFSISKRGASL